MDKKTRTLHALTGKPVDRPPMAFWHHYSARLSLHDCVRAQEEFYRNTHADFIKMMSDGYSVFPDNSIRTQNDWKTLKLPKMSDPFVTGQLDRVKAMREAVQDETFVFYNVFNAFSVLRDNVGDELIMAGIRAENPDFMAAYDAVTEFQAELAVRLITDAGAKGVFHPLQNAERGRFTVEEYARWIAPHDKKVIEASNRVSDTNIIHLCGWAGNRNDLRCWQDYSGAVIHWDVHTDRMSLREGRDYFPHKTAVMGGFDNKMPGIIYTGTREEVQQYTVELVRETGRDALIIGADCSLLNSIDPARLCWIAEALDSTIDSQE